MAIDLGMDVDTSVTPALHPQVVASMDDYDSETEGELRQVVDAFSGAYQGVLKVNAARQSVAQDITLTDAAKVLAASDVADKVLETATARFDKVAANMKAALPTLKTN
jgi:hypothetical protein